MIYLIITTSICNKIGIINNEHRKNQYIHCISAALALIENEYKDKIKPIIVENNGKRETYLDGLSQTKNCDVIYTDNNQHYFPHKGVNELLDIKHIIQKYNIEDNDTIIKLTGRYKLLNSSFLNSVIRAKDDYDAFVKFFNVCSKKYMYDDCVLGLFAIKCKYLNNFKYECKKSAECEFASFVRNNIESHKIMEIDTLNLECCFADDLRILIV